VLREADGAIEPQAVGIKTGSLAQSVVAGVVVEAGEITAPLQGAKNGHVGDVEGRAELLQGGNGPVLEVVKDRSLLGGQWHLL
jgi:hypothetical protein